MRRTTARLRFTVALLTPWGPPRGDEPREGAHVNMAQQEITDEGVEDREILGITRETTFVGLVQILYRRFTEQPVRACSVDDLLPNRLGQSS